MTLFVARFAFVFLMTATTAVAGLLAVENINTLTSNCTFVTFSLAKVLHQIDTFKLVCIGSNMGSPVSPNDEALNSTEHLVANSSATASLYALSKLV